MKMNEQNQDQVIRNIYKKVQTPDMVKSRIDETLHSLEQQNRVIDVEKKKKFRRKMFSPKKAAAIAAAAVLCVGGTVYAASRIYQMHLEKEHTYEASFQVTSEEEFVLPEEVEDVELKVNYLPEGFTLDPDKGAEHYYTNPQIEDAGYYLGAPMLIDSADPLTVSYVQGAETLTVNGHDAVYIDESPSLDNTWHNGTVYIVYEDVGRILPVHLWGHAEKQELLKIAENIELLPTGNMVVSAELPRWSDVVSPPDYGKDEDIPEELVTEVNAKDMANTHQVGETFPFKSTLYDGSEIPLEVSVADVQTADDLSLLTAVESIRDDWKELEGPDGKLIPDTLNYIKLGDGKDSLDELVRTESSPVKLVYVTAEYTNPSEEALHDVYYFVSLMSIEPDGDSYRIFDRTDDTCDIVENEHHSVGWYEMSYCDVTGGPRNNNYIPEILPGETVTVHLAWMVNTDELDKLYLDFTGTAGYKFSEESLETGLVKLDIDSH